LGYAVGKTDTVSIEISETYPPPGIPPAEAASSRFSIVFLGIYQQKFW